MLITVDYLTFATSESDEKKIADFLGLDFDIFERGNSRFYGYEYGYYCQGIRILFSSSGRFRCYVSMSGSGCRTYETLSGDDFSWRDFLQSVVDVLKPDFRRIDIAVDDYSGLFSVDTCIKYYAAGKYAGLGKRVVANIFDEEIFLVGSSKSNCRVRIYNKALERGFSNEELGHPWLRCEMQLRNGNAEQLINEWLSSDDLPRVFSSHLLGFMRFLSKPNDKENSQRINTAGFWHEFCGNVEAVKFVSSPGSDYNLSKVARFLHHQCFPSIKVYLLSQGISPDDFYNSVTDSRVKLNTDQKALLRQFAKNSFAAYVQSFINDGFLPDEAVVRERMSFINSVLSDSDVKELDEVDYQDIILSYEQMEMK